MMIAKAALLITIFASLGACATLRRTGHVQSGSAPTCATDVDIGVTQVVLKTDWRDDQKEPIERAQMASEIVEAVFQDLPCGRYLAKSNEKITTIDTLVEITLREFGPELVLSVPVLWSTNTDVDVSIRVIDVGSGRTRFAASETRKEGGAFAIKSLSDVPATFESLLRDWIGSGDSDRQS